MNKIKWSTISTGGFFGYPEAFWYDDQTLYGLKHGSITKEYKYQLNALDLRDNKAKWSRTGINFGGMDEDGYKFF